MEHKLSQGAKSGTQGTHKDPGTDTGTQDAKLKKSEGKIQTSINKGSEQMKHKNCGKRQRQEV